MKNLTRLILLLTFALSAFSHAHPGGHDKPQTIHKTQAITTASHQVRKLIDKGVIDKSWGMIEATNAMLTRSDSKMSWIITFNNPIEVDDDKKLLTVQLTSTGDLISTNFTKK